VEKKPLSPAQPISAQRDALHERPKEKGKNTEDLTKKRTMRAPKIRELPPSKSTGTTDPKRLVREEPMITQTGRERD